MKTIEKCFKVLDKISFILSALCVGGMLICVFLQVVARIFQFSINWTTEMSQYFFLWSTTFASYVAARRGKLIGVELLLCDSAPQTDGADHSSAQVVDGHDLYHYDDRSGTFESVFCLCCRLQPV